MKNNILLYPFLVFSFIAFTVHAKENIAPNANVTTSHVSPWETLGAINTGWDPERSYVAASAELPHGAYGNWRGNDGGRWNWVGYEWDDHYIIDRSAIYWWTDNMGIHIPDTSYIEYRNALTREWELLPNHTSFTHYADQYNEVTFDPVITDGIRYHMMSESEATGILQWKVYGVEGDPDLFGSTLSVSPELESGSTSRITITAIHTADGPIAGYTFVMDVIVTNNITPPDGFDEVYIVNGEEISTSVYDLAPNPTGNNGETAFDVSLPENIDPGDGIELVIKFSDGEVVLGRLSYRASPLTPPELSAAQENITVDDEIKITFTDDPSWRERVTSVLADGAELIPLADYTLTPGFLTLIPQSGNEVLAKQGTKMIKVKSTGYEDAVVYQEILHGQVNAIQSYAKTMVRLFRNTETQIRIVASDMFGNGISDYVFGYDIEVTNNDDTTNEVYKVGPFEVTGDMSGLETPETGDDGESVLDLKIPANVDPGDGISIIFRLTDGTPVDTISYHYFENEEKDVHVQHGIRNHPDFEWERTAQSENFIIFWGQNITGDPRDSDLNPNLWFDPDYILEVSEDFFEYVTTTMQFLDPDGRNTSRYKFEIVMNETWTHAFTGWAFGGPVDNTTGGIWIHPGATRGPGVLVHEIGHACQGMVTVDNPGHGFHAPYSGFFWESHTEWMRGVYVGDNWQGLLQRYIMTSMMHFSTIRRYYQNFAFPDYVADEYGFEAVNNMWHKADMSIDHPLTSFRDNVMNYSQNGLNDDMLKSAMRNVTWDTYSGEHVRAAFESVRQHFLSRMHTVLDSLGGEPGWFIVPEYVAPSDYGYNIIPLFPDEGVTEITVQFEGLENAPSGGAGSRYGFVAVSNDGSVRYSGVYSDEDKETTFSLMPDDQDIYMVVSGAPGVHHNYGHEPGRPFVWEPGYTLYYRYPYKVRFKGALPAGHKDGYNSQRAVYPGAPHSNGGGWVATTATVAASAYVGPNAQVLGNATVSGSASIEGYAIVANNATVRDQAVVKDHAQVTGNSIVRDNALVEKTAMLYNATVRDQAVATGSAILLNNTTLSGNAVARDLVFLWGRSLSGTAIVGGDSEYYNNINSGTYMSNRRTGDPDGQILHEFNVDVNPAWSEYHYPMGPKPSKPLDLDAGMITASSIELQWEASIAFSEEIEYYVMQKRGAEWEVIGFAGQNQFIVTGLDEGAEFTFRVQARDRSGNLSLMSNELSVNTGITSAMLIDNTLTGVSMYPNPARDMVVVEVDSEHMKHITVHDLSGRVVYRSVFTGKTMLCKTEIGPGGVYLVVISDGTKNHAGKLVIQ